MNSGDTAAFNDAAWKRVSGGDDTSYTYVRGNDVLSFLDQSFFAESEGGGYIRLNYYAGFAGNLRPGGISKADALPLIRAAVDADPYFDYEKGKDITALIEEDLPEAFDKMQIQIFSAYGEKNGFGCFVVSHGKVLRTFWGFSYGLDFSYSCVVDIDKDGEYELIGMYVMGSGITVCNIHAYKIDAQSGAPYAAYSNEWVNAWLNIVKVSDTDVKLLGGDGTDYGLLRVEGDRLLPADAENFPFKDVMDFAE
ncbi:MAG: hypothetical protein LBT21_01915 [Oscillospiraceae bacterium]|jgi:hypothetical protein|nr:hypothetical protein [Oscillospiraceae bacterium]